MPTVKKDRWSRTLSPADFAKGLGGSMRQFKDSSASLRTVCFDSADSPLATATVSSKGRSHTCERLFFALGISEYRLRGFADSENRYHMGGPNP